MLDLTVKKDNADAHDLMTILIVFFSFSFSMDERHQMNYYTSSLLNLRLNWNFIKGPLYVHTSRGYNKWPVRDFATCHLLTKGAIDPRINYSLLIFSKNLLMCIFSKL